jgi:hypothetical protein
MKKLVLTTVSLLLVLSSLGQTTTSLNETSIKWGDFTSTIVLTNESLIDNIVVSQLSKNVMDKMYKSENWGTLFQSETFTSSIKSSTCLFWYVHRITDLGTTKKAGETGEEEILKMPQKDNEAKLILVNVEFTDPVTGSIIRKIIQIEAMADDANVIEPVRSKFKASITNEVLGLKTLKFICEKELAGKMELINEELNLKIVLSKNQKEQTILAPFAIPDGLYRFKASVETGLDIPPVKMMVELFLEDGKLTFSQNSVNGFFLEDKEKIFVEKIVNVRFHNTRSEPVTIYIPQKTIAQKSAGNKAVAVEISSASSEYFAFTLQPGKTKILKMKSGLISTVVYNGRSSKLFNISVTEENFCNAKY